MIFPFSLIGYLLEPIYLRLLADRPVITESKSAQQDLIAHGFRADKISIVPVGLTIKPVADLKKVKKYHQPTLLYLGSLRSMKRPFHLIQAFELAKREIPALRLIIAGSADKNRLHKCLARIRRSPFSRDIKYLGKVNSSKKIKLMQRSHVIGVTSVKEGWGLIVTEANSQGTPAVVYDVDGLRDACLHQRTGLVCPPTPPDLARGIVQLLSNPALYKKYQLRAWKNSLNYHFDNSYRVFSRAINRALA
jgi:glycosyltransferase involved in cell wall biosynthesis